jgi:PIN domain nuclease of toxin-antitoxin system
MKSNAFLLDTHTFLWALDSFQLLSNTAREIILEKSNEIFLSKVSYWEICLKISKGKLSLGTQWEEKLENERKANRFHWLELVPKHCEPIIIMPWHHKDPFDRMLVAQAQCENLTILSCDQKLSLYSKNVVW